MKAHTVLLLHAGIGFTQLEDFTNAFRSPVIAFSTRDADGSGLAEVASGLGADERDVMASTLFDLYRMTAAPEASDDPRELARERLGRLRDAVTKLEQALAAPAAEGESTLIDAAEALHFESEQLAFGLYSWDASHLNA